MEKNTGKAWLYLLPAILFFGLFMVYPLIDVFVYSFEEGYNSASQTYFESDVTVTSHGSFSASSAEMTAVISILLFVVSASPPEISFSVFP